jgi:hypothetical protein
MCSELRAEEWCAPAQFMTRTGVGCCHRESCHHEDINWPSAPNTDLEIHLAPQKVWFKEIWKFGESVMGWEQQNYCWHYAKQKLQTKAAISQTEHSTSSALHHSFSEIAKHLI